MPAVFQTHKRPNKSVQNKSKPWRAPAQPVWSRWTSLQPMASMEIPAFCAQSKDCAVEFWLVYAATGSCMRCLRRQPLTKEAVTKCTENALPSRSRKPGEPLLRWSSWKMNTGARCAWNTGSSCMKRKAPMCRMMSFGPACIWSEKNRPLPFGWPG